MEYLATKLPTNYKQGIKLLAAIKGQSMESLASEMIIKMFHDDEYYYSYLLAYNQRKEEKKREEILELKKKANIAMANYMNAIGE